MKNVVKGTEPEPLRNYRESQPQGTWDKKGQPRFKSSNNRYQAVIRQLKVDQGNLCAYCEISLLEDSDPACEDKRVEHFHPKSDTRGSHNWALDWQNLLATCHGGNSAQVAESGRYTSPDVSCDIPKKDKNLDEIILNPLNLPSFPLLFKFENDGSISVDHEACDAAGIEIDKAQNTIDELCLDAPRLRKFRKEVIEILEEKLFEQIQLQELSDSEAKVLLAEDLLIKDEKGHWPDFFSTIRYYLLPESDLVLNNSGYTG